MPITTDNEKLAVIELEDYQEPALVALPVPAAFAQGDQQQLLWGYPGILWASSVGGTTQPQGVRLGMGGLSATPGGSVPLGE